MPCLCVLLVAGCVTSARREISGRLVQPVSREPIADQKLDLDRPPGNYPGISMLLLGIPQPVSIVTATTDRQGHFSFTTTKDRGRYLEIRLAGHQAQDLRSHVGYAIEHLHDSRSPSQPQVSFDARLIHDRRGGFRSFP